MRDRWLKHSVTPLAISVAIACTSCSQPPPASQHGKASGTLGLPPPDAGTPPAAAGPSWPRFPTIGNAGAEHCKLARTVSLGPIVEEPPVVGYGPAGGLVAWRQAETTLTLQRLGEDAVSGAAVSIPLEPGLSVERIFALRRGFIVVVRLWDWKKNVARWWGLVVGHDGQPRGGRVDLGMSDMDILEHQIIDEERIALLLFPAAIAANRDRLQDRWQTLLLDAGGALASKAGGELGKVERLSSDTWEPAELGGKHGWVVLRDAAPLPQGIFEGARTPAAAAKLLRPSDAIDARVYNLAVPPPRGPRGTIYEALPEPGLVRTHHGSPVGSAFHLSNEHRRDLNEVVWSGRYFVYPFKGPRGDQEVASLVLIDCAP